MIGHAKALNRLLPPGRLAILALAAWLLPLAPSWGQKDTDKTPGRADELQRRVPETDRPASLTSELANLDARIAAKTKELTALIEKGHIELASTAVMLDSPLKQKLYDQAANKLLQTELDLIEVKAELGAAQGQLTKASEAEQQSVPAADQVEARIEEEFKKDPDTAALIGEIKEARDVLANAERIAVLPKDPARAAASLHLKTLRAEYEKLWADQYDGLKQKLLTGGEIERSLEDQWKAKVGNLQLRLDTLNRQRASLAERVGNSRKNQETNPDALTAGKVNRELASLLKQREHAARGVDPVAPESKSRPSAAGDDEQTEDDNGLEASERIEERLKELADKLAKDAGPVAEEFRKVLERAVGEFHRSLQKNDLTAEELRKAVEKSGDELRKALERGGPVEKELHEAAERAREDLREAIERGQEDIERAREAPRRRARAPRQNAEETKGRDRPEAKDRARPDTEEKAGERSAREELAAARREVRELRLRLDRATRQLEQARRGAAVPRPAAPRRPIREMPAPRAVVPPGPRGEVNEHERRFRELDQKLNRLLEELQELKRQRPSTGKN